MRFKRKQLALPGTVAVAGLAYAVIVTQLQFKPEIAASGAGNSQQLSQPSVTHTGIAVA